MFAFIRNSKILKYLLRKQTPWLDVPINFRDDILKKSTFRFE